MGSLRFILFYIDVEPMEVALIKRLGKFQLKLNECKIKLVSFSNARKRVGKKKNVFDSLGFTFYLGCSRKEKVIVKGKIRASKLAKSING